MIKMSKNGFTIEVDSIEDARKLLDGFVLTASPVAPTKKLGRPYGSKDKARRKSKHFTHWTRAELDTTYNAMKNKWETGRIGKYAPLREAHSKVAIINMVGNIKAFRINSSSSQIVKDAITDYKNAHTTSIPVKSEFTASSSW